MNLKIRLIIVFSVLTVALFAFGTYTGNTIRYLNKQNTVSQHVAVMNSSILKVEVNQLHYVYTGSREDASDVYEGLTGMFEQLESLDYDTFTSDQHNEAENIRLLLSDYDKAFSQLISLSDQVTALSAGLDDDLEKINSYISLLSTDSEVKINNVSGLRTLLVGFYTEFNAIKDTYKPEEDGSVTTLNQIKAIAIEIQEDLSLPISHQITGLRIVSTISNIEENLSKFSLKKDELARSSNSLMERTHAISDSISQLSVLQNDIIADEQQSIYIFTNIILALTLGLFLIAIVYTMQFISRNLNQLLQTTNQIADGKYKTRIESVRKDEFGQLSTAINHMAESLETSAAQQEEIMLNLEKIVDDRTSALSDAKSDLEMTNRELELEKERLAKMAVTDELTGLHNRRAVLQFLQEQINVSLRYNHSLTIMEVDLDRFKEVNDKHGHLAGDEVLRKVANIFMGNIRQMDLVGRFGGEEFLFIFPETTLEQSKHLIERIRTKVNSTKYTFSNISMTFSAGVVEFSDETASELIHRADKYLYRAKANGRNRIEYESEKEPID